MNISSILMVPRVVLVARCYFRSKTILTMELIRARRVTLQICILYKPENSVILLSGNVGLERRWIRRKRKDYFLHRALRNEIFVRAYKNLTNVQRCPVELHKKTCLTCQMKSATTHFICAFCQSQMGKYGTTKRQQGEKL